MENTPENQINIELTEDVADGTYSNLAIISHSQSEFIIDFVQIMPGVPKGKVKSRIIMTPENAKRLMFALTDNVRKFESHNGTLNIDESPSGIPPIQFGGTNNQA